MWRLSFSLIQGTTAAGAARVCSWHLNWRLISHGWKMFLFLLTSSHITVTLSPQSCVSSSEGTFPKSRLTFSDVVPPIVMMDPRVCPPSLNNSQSLMSSLDKSPSGGFKAGHSRNDSAGSSRNSRQVVSEPFLFIKMILDCEWGVPGFWIWRVFSLHHNATNDVYIRDGYIYGWLNGWNPLCE